MKAIGVFENFEIKIEKRFSYNLALTSYQQFEFEKPEHNCQLPAGFYTRLVFFSIYLVSRNSFSPLEKNSFKKWQN